MKKFILPIVMMLLILSATAQNYLIVQGVVTNLSTGAPVPNQLVVYHNDSVPLAGYFYRTTYTNVNGQYYDTVILNSFNTQGNLYIRTMDCQNYWQTQWFTFNPSQLNITANFSICVNSNPCQANYTYNQNTSLTVNFTDLSVGGGSQRLWNFGDGTTSTSSNPVHVFPAAGYYNVSLTIGALGTTCYNTYTQTIYVWDNSGGGCQAAFYTVPDSTNPNQIFFFNQSTGNILSYSWSFGDGTTSNIMNPVHTYSLPGTYTVCLTVYGDSSCYDQSCQTITISGGGNCQANFMIYQDSLTPSGTYHFLDLSTGNIALWTWNFGDGTTQTISFPQNPNVTHTYAVPGIYGVCLTIQNNNGSCFDFMCDTLYVGGQPGCQAYFTYYQDSIILNGGYQFVDQSQGNITSWYWNFGDPSSGTSNISTLQNPVHIFSPGIYTVCLTIQGADSTCHDTYCQTIVVQGGNNCEADFEYTTIPVSKTVSFIDISIGNPTSWVWSFGDGTSSTLQNPVHVYPSFGTYYVTLAISGNNCQSTITKPVTIYDSTNLHQVYGQVFGGNFPISQGIVMIFSLDTLANTLPYFEATTLDSNGVYYFTTVPDGNYYIQAIPLEPSGYLPTYFGNTIYWEMASVVVLGTPNNPYNINLVPSYALIGGQGSITGQIGMGDVSNVLLDKINMIIKNEQGNPIGFNRVASTGAFGFPSLAYGTYYLKPEMPGASSDQVAVTLSAASPNAVVNMTYNGNSIWGINDPSGIVEKWNIYPVPVRDNLNISLTLKQSTSVYIEVINLMGQVVNSNRAQVSAGTNVVQLSLGGLSRGLYTYRVTSAEGIHLTGKLTVVN